MILPDTPSLFAAGMSRAAQHWLAYWRRNGHDSEAQRQARGHALRALMWCADWGTAPDTAADLAVALHAHMMYAGQWAEWEACLCWVIDRIRPSIGDEQRFELQYCLAELYFRLHRLNEAVALAQDNGRIALAAKDIGREERVASLQAETYLNMAQYETALAHAEHAADLAASLGNAAKEADGQINLARALLGQGRISEAEPRLARALALASAANNKMYTAKSYLFLGHAAAARDQWALALKQFRAALHLVEGYGDEVGRGTVLSNIGRALTELGAWDAAQRTLEESQQILRCHGNTPAAEVAQQRLRSLAARRKRETAHDA